MTLGILTPAEGLSGFSNEATVVVAAMFALNAGVVGTGGLDPLIRVLSRIRRPWLLTFAILLDRLSARRVRQEHRAGRDVPAGRARRLRAQQDLAGARADADVVRRADGRRVHAARHVVEPADQQHRDRARPAGVRRVRVRPARRAAGARRHRLPDADRTLAAAASTSTSTSSRPDALGKFVTELKVMPGSPLIGQPIGATSFSEKYGVHVLELLRGERAPVGAARPGLQAGRRADRARRLGAARGLQAARRSSRSPRSPTTTGRGRRAAHADRGDGRAGRAPRSATRSTRSTFRWNYKATVLAVQRRGAILREALRQTRLQVGDMLMLLVDEDALAHLRRASGLVVLSERGDTRQSRRKAPIAIAILVARRRRRRMGWLPIVVSALLGCVAMALTGCFNFEDVYECDRLAGDRAARRDPAARHRARQDRPRAARRRCRHAGRRRPRTARRAADGVSADCVADRDDGPQSIGRADGADRDLGRACAARAIRCRS